MITVDVGGREVARVGPGESACIRGDDGRPLVRITDSSVEPHPPAGSEGWVRVDAVLALLAHQQREQGKELAALHPDRGGYCKTCGGTFPCATRRLADEWVGAAKPGAVTAEQVPATNTVSETLSRLRRGERIVESIADRLGAPIPPAIEED